MIESQCHLGPVYKLIPSESLVKSHFCLSVVLTSTGSNDALMSS